MARILENSANNDEVKKFVERVEEIDRDYDKWKMERAAEGKQFAEDRREIYSEAKDRGVNVKALKAAVKARSLERKAEAVREDLDSDDVDSYDTIRLALGDLADNPLGQAALRGANGTSTGEAPRPTA